jgi:hypothetical protein
VVVVFGGFSSHLTARALDFFTPRLHKTQRRSEHCVLAPRWRDVPPNPSHSISIFIFALFKGLWPFGAAQPQKRLLVSKRDLMPTARQIAARATSQPSSIPARAIPAPSMTRHTAECLATSCPPCTIPHTPRNPNPLPDNWLRSAIFRQTPPPPPPPDAPQSPLGAAAASPRRRAGFARAVANLPSATPTIQTRFQIIGFVPLFFAIPATQPPVAGPNASPSPLRAASAIAHFRVEGARTWNQNRPKRNHRCRDKFASPRILPYRGFQ